MSSRPEEHQRGKRGKKNNKLARRGSEWKMQSTCMQMPWLLQNPGRIELQGCSLMYLVTTPVAV